MNRLTKYEYVTGNQQGRGMTLLSGARRAMLIVLLGCCGCTDTDTDPSVGVVTDMYEDFDHEHKHQHSDYGGHEHEHAEKIDGSHSHEHAHGHRHNEPLFGGRLFSIGHTHHENGAAHFHAEVMPLEDDTIRFYLLTDSADAGLQDYAITAQEVSCLISVNGQEAQPVQCSFTAVDDEQPASEFCLLIPEHIAGADAYSVMVPNLEVRGQNFSFHVRRIQDKQERSLNKGKDSHE